VDEHLSEVCVDAPVMRLVGIGQRGPRDPATEPHVIEFARHGAQAGLDVAETLAESKLGKSQTKELIEARKSAHFVISAVTCHALVELVGWDVIDELGEDHAAGMHVSLSAAHRTGRTQPRVAFGSPNRKKPGPHVCI